MFSVSISGFVMQKCNNNLDFFGSEQNKQEEVDPQESLHKIVTSEGEAEDYSKDIPQLKEQVLEHISEFQMELETR